MMAVWSIAPLLDVSAAFGFVFSVVVLAAQESLFVASELFDQIQANLWTIRVIG